MEAKKVQVASPKSTEASANAASIVDFIGDIKTEVKKISWTSPEELKVYTKVVVATTFALGLGIYFMDLIIQGFLNGLGVLFRFIA